MNSFFQMNSFPSNTLINAEIKLTNQFSQKTLNTLILPVGSGILI